MSSLGWPGRPITLRRRAKNRAATVSMMACACLQAGRSCTLCHTVASKGAHAITVDWFTKDIPGNIGQTASQQQINDRFAGGSATLSVTKVVLGMRPAIVGTLLTTLVASLLAIPLGILGAVYLNEYGKKGRLASFIRFMSDVMTGVPSVVMGLFIYTVWVVPNGVSGASAFAGALALGCLMLPIVVRSSEEMLRLVPDNLREASAALGTRTWRTTLGVVLPAALPGHHVGLHAGRRPRGGGNGAAAVYDRGHHRHQLQLERRQHRAVDADLRQRHGEHERADPPGVGRGPHADHHGARPHDAGPVRDRPLCESPVTAEMEEVDDVTQTEVDLRIDVTPAGSRRTPRSAGRGRASSST